MNILISGAGIAGPTLAYWLKRYGFTPVLVERAPEFRTGGYVIDFWGLGYEVADRMGLIPQILDKGYLVREVRIVNGDGRRVAGFPVSALTQLAQDRYVSVARGDLAACIFRQVEKNVETIFGDSIARIEQASTDIQVTFQSGVVRDFDLVIGADGLHSRVRELAFGPQKHFETYLGYKVAAFEIDGYRPRDELVYVMHSEPGHQAARFAMHGDRTLFLFIFADPEVEYTKAADVQSQKALLRKRFGDIGWECSRILNSLDSVAEIYLDRVSQITMGSEPGSWTKRRVTLIGDAAFCVSLLAGQGAALAMLAAYILAGELHSASGDHTTAFRAYQKKLESLVRSKQRAALRLAGMFVPKTRISMFVRDRILNALTIPWIANLAFGRSLRDDFIIPDY